MSVQSPGSPEFQQFLQQCRRRFLLHTMLRGLAGVLLVGLLVILCSLAIDFVSPLPGSVRLLLLLSCSMAAIVAAWKLMIGPLRSGITDAELGAAIDLTFPGFQEAMATVVSVESPDAGENEAGSQRMRARVRQQINERLSSEASPTIMDHRTTLYRCTAIVSVLAVIAIPLMAWQSGSVLLLQRLFTPLTSRATATNLYFSIESPGDLVARGSDVQFRAAPQWRDGKEYTLPTEAKVVLISDEGRTDSLMMRYDTASGTFTGTLRGITDSVTWHIAAGRTATANRTLTVVDRPRQTNGQLTVTPPDYTGFPPVVFPGAEGRMEAFAGSSMQLQLQFNKPVERAELVWTEQPVTNTNISPDSTRAASLEDSNDVVPLELADDGLSATLTFTAEREGVFELRLQDAFQLGTSGDTLRHLTLIHDQPPELAVRGIQSGEELRPNDIIPLDVTATDDVGIGDLELHLTTPDGDSEVFTAPADQRGRADILHAFRVDVTPYNFQDGDRIDLRVRVTDERPPEPHEVWWQDITLTVNSEAAAPGTRALSEESRQLIQQLESAKRQLREDTRTLRQLRSTSKEEWESRGNSDTTQLSERQQLLGRHLQDLAEQAEQHPLMEAAAKELNKLGQSLRAETGDRLQQAANRDYESAEELLRQSESQLIEAREQLGSIVTQLEEAAELEQDLAELNRLALQAEQLAAAARDLQQRQQMAAEELPPETDPETHKAQLQAESQQVEETRRQLTSDLTELLNEQRELQAAAQQALVQRQSTVASQAEALAERQQRVQTLMEYENAADPGATTAAQQQLAEDTAPLEKELAEIGRQVRLPGVGLEDQSSAVEAARQSAATAAEQAASAGQSAAGGEMDNAASAGSQAAAALNRVAQLAQNADRFQGQETRVPQAAGQSVTRALQHLTESPESDAPPSTAGEQPTDQSAESGEAGEQQSGGEDANRQEAESKSGSRTNESADGADRGANPDSQPMDDEGAASAPGSGNPQDPQPAATRERQLADAAEALSAAAGAALPGSILDQMDLLPLPGNMAGSAPGDDGSLGPAHRTGSPQFTESQRDWAQLHDELSHDVLSGRQEAIDSRYASMIRAYFRNLARSSADQPTEDP